jgi:hypothetical protein
MHQAIAYLTPAFIRLKNRHTKMKEVPKCTAASSRRNLIA